MIVKLKTQQLSSLEQVRSFMAGTDAVPFAIQAHQDRHQWIALSLKQFGYKRLRRAERGLIVRFLCRVSGYSRAQLTRLIAQWRCGGRLRDRRGPPAVPFAKRYGAPRTATTRAARSAARNALGTGHQEARRARLHGVQAAPLRNPRRHLRVAPVQPARFQRLSAHLRPLSLIHISEPTR